MDLDTPFFFNLETSRAGRIILNTITNNSDHIIKHLHYPMFVGMKSLIKPMIDKRVRSYFNGNDGKTYISGIVDDRIRNYFGKESKVHEENLRQIVQQGRQTLEADLSSVSQQQYGEFTDRCSAHVDDVLSQPKNIELVNRHLAGYDSTFAKWQNTKSATIDDSAKRIQVLEQQNTDLKRQLNSDSNSQTVFNVIATFAIGAIGFVLYAK